MNESILDLHKQIAAYVYELHELQGLIKNLAESPETDPIFMQETGDRYISLCNKLRITLEAYFKEESDAGLPAEFSYRKLYKQLKD